MQLLPCSGSSEEQRTSSFCLLLQFLFLGDAPLLLLFFCFFTDKHLQELHSQTPCQCSGSCTWGGEGVCSGSLQGSDRLQHVLQFTTLVQLRHVAAASDALLADKHTRDLQSDQDEQETQALKIQSLTLSLAEQTQHPSSFCSVPGSS